MKNSKMIEYRRQKVSEMLVEGASQYSIASSLGVSQVTITKDVETTIIRLNN